MSNGVFKGRDYRQAGKTKSPQRPKSELPCEQQISFLHLALHPFRYDSKHRFSDHFQQFQRAQVQEALRVQLLRDWYNDFKFPVRWDGLEGNDRRV